MHPDWIEEDLGNGKVLLKENPFETVFANDIDVSAYRTWTRFFQDKHHKNEAEYIIGSVIDLVKKAKDDDDPFSFPDADIVTGGFPCLAGNTLVLTEDGYIPITEVKAGMQVISHDGRLHSVTRFLDQGEKEVFKLTGIGFDDIIATGNHRFYCLNKEDQQIEWLDVDFLIQETDGTSNYEKYCFGAPITCLDDDAEPEYIWYKINRIEPAGIEHVYDITVADTHSFIANGCVVHNCCDFSVSGKRQGFHSTKSDTETNIDAPTPENRGMLYYWMKEVIELVEPKLCIAENVKGLTNLGDSQQIIEEDFRNTGEAGYVVIPARVIHSGDYGVAQNRERVFFFGFNKKYLSEEGLAALTSTEVPNNYDPYPVPTHDYTSKGAEGRMRFFNVSEAFAGLNEPDQEETDESQKVYSKAAFLEKGQGQTEVKLDGVGPTIRSKHHGNIEYRRLSKEHGGTHDEELASGLKERRMTVRECARIQSFPDDYEFVIKGDKTHSVSASAAYVLVGNAVPPVLAYNIARSLVEKWDLWF